MAVFEIGYCTRSEVRQSLDAKPGLANTLQIDRAIETAARDIDGSFHRVFYPTDDTRYFDWPNYQYAYPWRLWLKDNELASWPAVSVDAGTQAIPINQIFPGPWQNQPGPPFTWIELDRSTSAAFGGISPTPQRSTVVQGTFGFDTNKDQVATLASAVSTAGVSTVNVSDSSRLDAGAILIVGTERMRVQDSAMTSTTLTLSGSGCTTAAASDTVLTASGAGLNLFEVIQIGAERMLILDNATASNSYLVKRAYAGTVLTVHNNGDAINAARLLTVVRGDLGTTATTYLANVAVYRHRVPSAIRDLAIGVAGGQLTGEPSAWAGDPSAGGTHRVAVPLTGLELMAHKAHKRYARKARKLAV